MKETEFQSLLNSYRGATPAANAEPSTTVEQRLQARWEGAMAFFEPVFELFDFLHNSEIRLYGLNGGQPRQIPAGRDFRNLGSKAKLPPQCTVILNARSSLSITVKIQKGECLPLDRVNYVFACQLAEFGSSDTDTSFMTLPAVRNWVMRTIMEHRVIDNYVPPVATVPVAPVTPVPQEIEEITSPLAMSRVILVDPSPKD